ncbi:MAG: ABC transporter ATP-binding protein [Rhodobacteraceae bacterium]|nr:ABC transporter ATP-binding protein [Paracoccaceae bacterium]MBR26427.1 ABC transporter ATP-binding protein [Paracoccaceae bacterium]|tara:strand:+ start:95 stop:871 length:777 start_codon:yes stop_codon:yes gene_type:complete
MIEVENLTVEFGRGAATVRAVRGVSFTVAQGESYGLVGESGSGKSTVLRAIARINPEFGGAIRVHGTPLTSKRSRDEARRMQMVFQDPYGALHPRHTVDAILREPLEIHRVGDKDRRIKAALSDVGLGPEFRFRYPHQISGGQRQRIAVARALILEPEILLLDEPTSALDVSVQAEVLNLLKRLQRERGLTYLMVSHNLAVVAHICERVAVMNRGRVVEELTASTLRGGEPAEAYTRQLVSATEGYDREAVRGYVTYE